MMFRTALLATAILAATTIGAAAQTVALTFNIPGQPPVSHPAKWRPGITVEQAMQGAGIKYVTAWYPRLGNALVIAEGTPLVTNGGLGSPFWWLCVDGKAPKRGGKDVGMSQALIPSARSTVTWSWTIEPTCK
ncbi:hypothetical protein ACQR0Z_00065 [Bradyrhizobium sp. HKCCYLS3077]|uniref:hypothetical protein n=1 Tax=Bradyrhizobium sp. HKCCYLS3077 TaxID=3420761 RepID=UPI003EBBFB8B